MTTSPETHREELAHEIWRSDRYRAAAAGGAPSDFDRAIADRLISRGYRKPRTIGYGVVNQGNTPLMVNFRSRPEADLYARECSERVDQPFRVVEIVEPEA